MGKYVIVADSECALEFFNRNLDGFIALTKIAPSIFPNKKKAKRMVKRLNKHHGGNCFVVNCQQPHCI